ncbi:MAG: ribose-phosphate diphosphokinase [Candidatus Bathyarchaeia archaeon]
MRIVGGPSSVELARKLSESLNMPLANNKTKRFPDGEFYFKFEEKVGGEDLLIVQSLYPPQDAHLVEFLLIVHTAKDLGAKSIRAFVPYLAYSRQDERYLEGEGVSAAMVAQLCEDLGVKVLYTIDVHNGNVLKRYRIPVLNLTAAGELAKYFTSKSLKNPFVVSPDDEEMAIERAEHAARTISADYDYFEKTRDHYTGEIETFSKRLDVLGRDVIIIDDIISTGNTAANAARMLKQQGARKIFAGVSHALLRGDALKTLKEAGVEEIAGTDSVVNEFAKVSVAPVLAEALRNEMGL